MLCWSTIHHHETAFHGARLCITAVPRDSISWWRHQMETFSALLVICAEISPVTDEFPTQRQVKWSFDVFFDLHLNKCNFQCESIACFTFQIWLHFIWKMVKNILWGQIIKIIFYQASSEYILWVATWTGTKHLCWETCTTVWCPVAQNYSYIQTKLIIK